jgi:hypothetical protein
MDGTGSNDFRATALFVPEEHGYSVFEPPSATAFSGAARPPSSLKHRESLWVQRGQ